MPHHTAQPQATSFCALLERTPDSIVCFDNHLRIRYANPAVERTTGISAESLVGQLSRDMGVPESLVPTWELVLRQVWRSGHAQDFDLTVRTPRGERALQSRIIRVPAADGSVDSLLTIITTSPSSDREIAAEVGLAIGTVKDHVATILNKLNVADRTRAAVRAVELGLIQTDEP